MLRPAQILLAKLHRGVALNRTGFVVNCNKAGWMWRKSEAVATMALRVTRSLRAVAVMAAFTGLPAAPRRWWKFLKTAHRREARIDREQAWELLTRIAERGEVARPRFGA